MIGGKEKPADRSHGSGLRDCVGCGVPNNPEHNGGRIRKQAQGGRRSREKGNRAERAVVKYLQGVGFAAERIPLIGSAGGSYVGDLTVPLLRRAMCVEVKARATGFKQLYDWLVDRDLLIVKQDRAEPLVVVPLRLAAEIAKAADIMIEFRDASRPPCTCGSDVIVVREHEVHAAGVYCQRCNKNFKWIGAAKWERLNEPRCASRARGTAPHASADPTSWSYSNWRPKGEFRSQRKQRFAVQE
jgi:hypothetical protein